jgi:predicted RNA-binding Zn-ribbon protein involved in translation (DUF1610 family)
VSGYNTVVRSEEEVCPNCHTVIRRTVQFKYGNTRQHDYLIGDRISWGGYHIGRPVHRVRVLGFPENCPVCGYDQNGVYDVFINDDVIVDVVPGRTQPYEEAEARDGHYGYIVLEP